MKKAAHYQSLEYERIESLFAAFAADKRRPLRVLDYGCGQGRYLSCFRRLGCDVSGVDANPAYVAEAKDNGYLAWLVDEFVRSEAREFDIVFLSHLIEHLAPDTLVELLPRLCARLADDGRLVIVSPTPGERFYHDFSHVRPYLPQSLRHAFGQTGAPISFGQKGIIELIDIYFFKDPYRTRLWRSFYVGTGVSRSLNSAINGAFDALWRASAGRIGVIASWLGVYKLVARETSQPIA